MNTSITTLSSPRFAVNPKHKSKTQSILLGYDGGCQLRPQPCGCGDVVPAVHHDEATTETAAAGAGRALKLLPQPHPTVAAAASFQAQAKSLP